jgi:acetyltransferase-like isoleucine patch superfamily enzyme
MLEKRSDLGELVERVRNLRLRSRVFMIRWHLLGLKAAPTALVLERVTIRNPHRARLARRSRIGAGSFIKCVPGTFHLEEFASLSENCWVSCTESVRIERDAMVGPGCHITDANHGFSGLDTIRKQARTASPVTIGEGAWLGAGAKVLAGVRVGRGAVVGAGAVVTKDVPDFAIVGGVPARPIGSRRDR